MIYLCFICFRSYETLKKSILDDLDALEIAGLVSRDNDFQEIISSIASDIRNKNNRRIQRRDELRKIRTTLLNLEEKSNYLEEQRQAYLDYITSCMNQMSTKAYRIFYFTGYNSM